jgi:hypothetical protein
MLKLKKFGHFINLVNKNNSQNIQTLLSNENLIQCKEMDEPVPPLAGGHHPPVLPPPGHLPHTADQLPQ